MFKKVILNDLLLEPGHAAVAERLLARHRLRDVHGDPLAHLHGHDLLTGIRVSRTGLSTRSLWLPWRDGLVVKAYRLVMLGSGCASVHKYIKVINMM